MRFVTWPAGWVPSARFGVRLVVPPATLIFEDFHTPRKAQRPEAERISMLALSYCPLSVVSSCVLSRYKCASFPSSTSCFARSGRT
jgi:hypothetical protein